MAVLKTRPTKLKRLKPERVDHADQVGWLRLRLIKCYASDRSFQRSLRGLAQKLGDFPDRVGNDLTETPEEVENERRRAIKKFVERWGLTFGDAQAEGAIESWCDDYCGGLRPPPSALLAYFGWGTFRPPQRLDFSLKAHWDPMMESRKHAENRLRNSLREQLTQHLNSIEEAYLPYTSAPHRGRTNLDEQIDWLFQHQRYGRPYGEIQNRLKQKRGEEGSADAVRKACERLAEDMGLVLRSSKPEC